MEETRSSIPKSFENTHEGGSLGASATATAPAKEQKVPIFIEESKHEQILAELSDPSLRKKLLGFCCKLYSRELNYQTLAEDLVQDVLLRAIEKVDQIKKEKKLMGQLYTMARNMFLDKFRKIKSNPTKGNKSEPLTQQSNLGSREEDSEEIYQSPEGLTEDNLISRVDLSKFWGRLKEILSQNQLEIIKLTSEGFGVKEIAKKLDIAEGTVKSGLFRARKKIKAIEKA